MKKLVGFALLFFVIAFACSTFCLAAKPQVIPPDYFPLKVGDWWKYRWTSNGKSNEFTIKVVKTEKSSDNVMMYLIETTMPNQIIQDWYSKPQGWVQMHKMAYPKNNMTGEYSPVKKFIQNPLSQGASWEWKGTGMMGVEIEEKNMVKGNEGVEVPAGKFGTMRVDTDVLQGGSQVKKTYWYSNWIGLVKSMVNSNGIESTVELIDYSFKPVKKNNK